MKEFENIKQKIQGFANMVDSERGVQIEEEIASVQKEIEQAKASADKAADEGKTTDFQEYSSQKAMLSHRLEKLKAEHSTIIYPPITASEYNDIKKDLRDTMQKIKAKKYEELLKILDQGQDVICELDAVIKEYNSLHQKLQNIISSSDTDSNGNDYPLFGIRDLFTIDERLKDVFCDSILSSNNNLKYYIKNTMNRA